MLTKRQKATVDRFSYMRDVGEVMGQIVEAGFKDLSSVVAITKRYYPDTEHKDVADFWNFRNMNPDMLVRMQDVLTQLKSE